ncbi:hypothetical protein ACFTUC_17380 [Streptomyces sp. NPDC056944]|uniref:hypothetical protein n=1 Tax=Streptomyces sp. NPDC056944 TaxID=3345972 RepID=UPI00362A506F
MNELRKFEQGQKVKILTGGGVGVVHDYNSHGLVIVGDDGGILRAVVYEKDLELIEKTYTEKQVSEAAQAAMDLILQEIELDDADEELLLLMVNSTCTVLVSEMGADFEDVVEENYDRSVQEFKDERGW